MGSPLWVPKSLMTSSPSWSWASGRLSARGPSCPLDSLSRLADADVYHYLPDGDLAASGSSATLGLAHLYACTSIAGVSAPTGKTRRAGSSVSPLGRDIVTIFSLEIVPFLTSEIFPPGLPSRRRGRGRGTLCELDAGTTLCSGTFIDTVSPERARARRRASTARRGTRTGCGRR